MSGTGIERPAAGGSLTGKKILIVDEDAALRDSLSEQLQLHEEFATVLAETARDALEVVKKDYFDAILLDVGLPDMDGREACRLMRRSGVKVPIMVRKNLPSFSANATGTLSTFSDSTHSPRASITSRNWLSPSEW